MAVVRDPASKDGLFRYRVGEVRADGSFTWTDQTDAARHVWWSLAGDHFATGTDSGSLAVDTRGAAQPIPVPRDAQALDVSWEDEGNLLVLVDGSRTRHVGYAWLGCRVSTDGCERAADIPATVRVPSR